MGEKSNTGIWIIIILLALFVAIMGAFYFSLKSYNDKIPAVEVKEGVVIQEGESITLDMVGAIDERMIQYELQAEWEDGSINGLVYASDFHTVTVEEGTGNLKIKVAACGTNHEWTGKETIVKVEGK